MMCFDSIASWRWRGAIQSLWSFSRCLLDEYHQSWSRCTGRL